MESVFSQIIAGNIPSYKIAEDDNYYAFLDISPLMKGHTLVVPKKEIDYIFDLEDKVLSDMMIFSKKVAVALKKVIPCERIGVMIVGMEVPHAHIHLIPINQESDMLVSKTRLKMTPSEFETVAKLIREQL